MKEDEIDKYTEIKEKMALIQKECGIQIFSKALALFKTYGYGSTGRHD